MAETEESYESFILGLKGLKTYIECRNWARAVKVYVNNQQDPTTSECSQLMNLFSLLGYVEELYNALVNSTGSNRTLAVIMGDYTIMKTLLRDNGLLPVEAASVGRRADGMLRHDGKYLYRWMPSLDNSQTNL